MHRSTTEFLGNYDAVDDQGGRHRIDVYVDVLEVRNLDGSTQRAKGLKTHKMASNGGHVNVSDDRKSVEEVATGRRMRPVTQIPE